MVTNIVDWAESKFGFYVDRHYVGGKWLLKQAPIQLAPYHKRILEHIFTTDEDGKWPYSVVCWAEPAKSGKSAICALAAEYVGLHGDGDVFLISNKLDQAQSVMYSSLCDSVNFNPHLRTEPNRYELTFKSGNTIKAIPCNYRGESGHRYSLVVIDEPWGIMSELQERLIAEFKVDPTRLNCMQFFAGYAGYTGESEYWESLLNSGVKGEAIPELADITNEDGSPCCYRDGTQFTFWSHSTRQPWQTEEWKTSVLKGVKGRVSEYLRMIEVIFSEGTGNFCEPDAWQNCVSSDHRPLPRGGKTPVFVGLDLATSANGDDCALIGVYPDNGLVKVAFHHVWKGKDRQERLKLKESVYPYLIQASQDYSIQGVWFDPYQALSLAEDLTSAGILCVPVQQTHASRAPKDTALLELINNRQLCLYEHADFENLSSKANAKELGNGLIFIKKASGRSKIDLLVALSNVGNEAAQGDNKIEILTVENDIDELLFSRYGYVRSEQPYSWF